MRDRGIRHHERHRSDGAWSRHRRHVRTVAHRVPGPSGHTRRLRVPGARRPLRDRCPRCDPAGHHPVPDQRGHHRSHRCRADRRLVLLVRAAQPRTGEGLSRGEVTVQQPQPNKLHLAPAFLPGLRGQYFSHIFIHP
jgi:hypothetical protein